MTNQDATSPPAGKRLAAAFAGKSLLRTAFFLTVLALIDAFSIWFVSKLLGEGDWILAIFIGVITVAINIIFLVDGMYPYRWFSPGLALLIVMVIYPTIFTIYVAFTNYRDGNLLTQTQAQKVLESRTYLPADTQTYKWTAFVSKDGEERYGLWLIPDKGTGDVLFAIQGEVIPADEVDLGDNTLDEDGIPTGLADYDRVPQNRLFAILDSKLAPTQFGEEGNIIQLNPKNPLRQAGVFRQKYTFSNGGKTMFDNETGVTYEAKTGTYTPVDGPLINEEGQVIDADGQVLPPIRPGYYVTVGFDNFQRLFTNEKIREPFFRVFMWTVAHAFLTVFLTFSYGLFLAVILNAQFMPGRAVIRTALLVPYAIPAFISVLVWRGLLNDQLGIVNKMLGDIGIDGPNWRTDQNWVKIGILLIQLWLGFPYMMLITTGALQSIPRDIYEAARVDGANVFQQFRHLTLPLLLVAVGPLLIASFAFNFNNFTIVELFAEGGPPISPDTAAGHSDILIPYTYGLAFGSGRGADYAFASTISIVIFVMIAIITYFNFQFTQRWEETSENV